LIRSELESWLVDSQRRPLVMGILNVTPDSFSDGGRFATPEAAAEAGLAMLSAGADLLDIGGESTRPGALSVEAGEQIRRVEPVIELIRGKSEAILSIDTRSWQVAEAALSAGANLVNDVSAGRDDEAMLRGVAEAGVPIILMHMMGSPANMQLNPRYEDVTQDVCHFLIDRMVTARKMGIPSDRVLLDPGMGFGKTLEHSMTLLRDLGVLAALGRPVVVGASRKSFIGKILAEPEAAKRIWGDAAVISWAVANGAGMVRVHDVASAAQVARMTWIIKEGLRTED